MAQVRRQGGDTAGFAASDVKTGQMVALVGGSDFTNKDFGQNNYARLLLQPGSSYTPYDYAALIEKTDNSGAGSVLYETQGPLEGYPCTNKQRPKTVETVYGTNDSGYPGPTTLRYALGGSRNVPAV
jgi:membrane carboxypeptidase/penicillin-binding protein